MNPLALLALVLPLVLGATPDTEAWAFATLADCTGPDGSTFTTEIVSLPPFRRLSSYEETCKEASEKCEKLCEVDENGDPVLSGSERTDCENELKGMCYALRESEKKLNGLKGPAKDCYERATATPPTWNPNRSGNPACKAKVPPAPAPATNPDGTPSTDPYPDGMVVPCKACEEGFCVPGGCQEGGEGGEGGE